MITPIKTVNFYRFINGYTVTVEYSEASKQYLVSFSDNTIPLTIYSSEYSHIEYVEGFLSLIETIQTNEE